MPDTNSHTAPNISSTISSKNPQQVEMTVNGGGNVSVRIVVDIQGAPSGSNALPMGTQGGSQESKEPGDGRVYQPEGEEASLQSGEVVEQGESSR